MERGIKGVVHCVFKTSPKQEHWIQTPPAVADPPLHSVTQGTQTRLTTVVVVVVGRDHWSLLLLLLPSVLFTIVLPSGHRPTPMVDNNDGSAPRSQVVVMLYKS